MSSGSACLRMRSANPSTSLGRLGGVDESRVSSIRFGNCSTVSPAAAPNAPAGPGSVAGSSAYAPAGPALVVARGEGLAIVAGSPAYAPAGPGALYPGGPHRVPPAYAPAGPGGVAGSPACLSRRRRAMAPIIWTVRAVTKKIDLKRAVTEIRVALAILPQVCEAAPRRRHHRWESACG